MKRTLSIAECFDAQAAKDYLKRSRIECIIWYLAFAVMMAAALALYVVYGVNAIPSKTLSLSLALVFSAVGLGGLVGCIVSTCRYSSAKRTVYNSATYIKEVAALRSDVVMAQLESDVKEVVFRSHGFYYGDIDTPFQMRCIRTDCFSSNYQTAVLYVDGNHLCYRSAVFSLINQEERMDGGSIPFDQVTSIGIIKANGIDLFCAQLKVAFGSQCMLFALGEDADYAPMAAALHTRIFG